MGESLCFRVSAFSNGGPQEQQEIISVVKTENYPTVAAQEMIERPQIKIEDGPSGSQVNEPQRSSPDVHKVGFFGVFHGHGGHSAAEYGSTHLWETIKKQKDFWSDNPEKVKAALKKGFIACHNSMWKAVDSWPQNRPGFPSTSGTTASIVVVRGFKMYIAHVGDSAVVLGSKENGSPMLTANKITRDHKPDVPSERERIEDQGGRVINRGGVNRVVWNRPIRTHAGPLTRSTRFVPIPFLAVTRSLGDLWSCNFYRNEYVVSPEPDTSVMILDPRKHRYVILGSKGLWNVISPSLAVNFCHNHSLMVNSMNLSYSKKLVNTAQYFWYNDKCGANEVTAIVIAVQEPGKPFLNVQEDEIVAEMANGGRQTNTL